MPFPDPARFQTQMLQWFESAARKLPWRETRDPYKIWVSEIMLQQTQVDTVIPYYNRWIEKFPTLESLAKASLSTVMKYWAGLGYYRRVRMLHEGAKQILRDNGGRVPETAEKLLKLSGIGRYTAGAIASIAFGQKSAVLDGNVIRVLTRLTAFKGDIQDGKTIQTLWNLAEELVPAKNPGDFNQSMMELGATICTPQNPKCLICPVSGFCEARKKNSPEDFPVKAQKEKQLKMKTFALVLRKNGKVLIRRQPVEERWGGLWMFPFWKNQKTMLEEFALSKDQLKHKMTIQHGFTKYQVRLDVFEHQIEQSFKNIEKNTRWVPIAHLPKFAFPSPHQKIVKELVANHG